GRVGTRPCPHGDHGGDDLPPLLVGDADDGGGGDIRMAEQGVFDLAGRQVLAALDDDVVGPALDEDIALGIEVGEVAGNEPAAVVWGLGRVVHVVAGDLGAGDAEPAHFAGGHHVAVL